MNQIVLKKIAGHALLLVVWLTMQGCAASYRPATSRGLGMEKYAEERYAQALLYMEASRFELAKQQFAIVEKTAVSSELRRLAHEGYTQAAGVIESKR